MVHQASPVVGDGSVPSSPGRVHRASRQAAAGVVAVHSGPFSRFLCPLRLLQTIIDSEENLKLRKRNSCRNRSETRLGCYFFFFGKVKY